MSVLRNYFLAFAVRTSRKKLRWEDKKVNKDFHYHSSHLILITQIFKQGTVATELKEEKSVNKVPRS